MIRISVDHEITDSPFSELFQFRDVLNIEKEYRMKNIWKWILGIVLILAVVAALVAVPFFMRNYMATNFRQPTLQNTTPANPGFNNGPQMRGPNQQGQLPGRFNGFNGPMMRGGRNFQRGFMPFGFGFMLFGGILRLVIPLLLLGLLLFGAYQLGKNAGIRSVQVAAAPVALPAAPAEPPVTDESETPAS
jgi:hypothetical protein